MLDVPYERQFVCFFHWLGWAHISLGLHVHWTSPNIELHVPFGFVRIGWQGVYKSGANSYRSFGKPYSYE